MYKRRDITAKLVQRAENNGYKAIVLTGDSPRHGRREADIKNKWSINVLTFIKFLGTKEAITYASHVKTLILMNLYRIIIPELKNVEGLLSTKIVTVSRIVPILHLPSELFDAPLMFLIVK